ncbi:MAG: FlgD immunoglobulin-like domain containing protein, partial [Fibrobacterota bacterium]
EPPSISFRNTFDDTVRDLSGGQSISVPVSFADSTPNSTISLYSFRDGRSSGSAWHDSSVFYSGSGTSSLDITADWPVDSMINGLYLYASAYDGTNNPSSDYISIPLKITNFYSRKYFFSPGGKNARKWKCITVPAELDSGSNTVKSVFQSFGTSITDTTWKLFMWDYDANGYYQMTESDIIKTGYAYWLINDEDMGGNYLYIESGNTPGFNGAWELPMPSSPQSVWFDFGSPFSFEISAYELAVASGLDPDSTRIYSYNEASSSWSPVEMSAGASSGIKPWTGYAIYLDASTRGDTLRFYPNRISGGGPKKLSPFAWEASLVINGEKSSITFGAAENASEEFDKYDCPMPPSPSGERFGITSKMEGYKGNLLREIRETGKDGYVWPVELSPRKEGVNSVSIDAKGLPEGFTCYLEDTKRNLAHDFSEGEYKYKSDGSPRVFRIITGTSAFVKNNLSSPSDPAFHLSGNIPNPFNPSTRIDFSVPELENNFASETRLTIRDLKGRTVFKTAETAEAGTHSFIWNGKLPDGSNAASGIYIYRIEVISPKGKRLFRASRRMTLIK